MKAENYISIQGWMRTELDLSGTELLLYAVIYGFSQAGMGKYTGTLAYLADWAGCTPRRVRSILGELVERGLLIREGTHNAPTYAAVRYPEPVEEEPELGVPVDNSPAEPVENSTEEVVENSTGRKKFPARGEIISGQGGNNFRSRGEKISPNNINNNIYKYKYIHTTPTAREAGVENSTVDNSPDAVGAVNAPPERKEPAGVNRNVFLTPSEKRELWRLIPNQAKRYVDRLSRWKVGRVQTMDDYQRLRGWMEQDGALVKERELEAAARLEDELIESETAELERRIMERRANYGD